MAGDPLAADPDEDHGIVVRRVEGAADESACKDLENTQPTGWRRLLGSFCQVSVELEGGFGTMAGHGFEACAAFLAENKATRQVVGSIRIGMRSVASNGRCQHAAVLSNLRVHAECRRLGVAGRLLVAAERVARGWNVDLIWLSVGQQNIPAKEFFKQAGYSLAVYRFALPKDGLIFRARAHQPYEVLEGEAAKEVLNSSSATEAMWPSDGSDSLLQSPGYVCTVVCRSSDDSVGAVSLWDTSVVKRFWIRRLIVPVSWARHIFSPAGAVLVLALWAGAVVGCVSEVQSGRHMSALLMLLVVALAFCAYIAWRLGRALSDLITSRGLQLKKVQLFAPIAEGPSGKRLLQEALQAADSHAGALGFMSRMITIDARDENLVDIFRNQAGVDVVCYQKRFDQADAGRGMEKKQTATSYWPLRSFCDPRDAL